MSSARVLELVNCLHHKLSSEQNSFPFGGKQVILVGEFLQLQPVPSRFDSGELMFFSPVFKCAIAHRIQLRQVMRRTAREDEFAKALQEVRMGECSPESFQYLTTLSRELDTGTEEATHIFFRHEDVFLHNRGVVDQMPGNQVTLRANLVGDTENFRWPGEEVLTMKEGCQVMLVWNLTETLKIGSRGKFVAMSNGKALVHFKNEGIIHIGQESWSNHSRTGQKIGEVTQYPLILAYAITCHKSQGLELPYVVVHCSSEFVSGLTYVGISRTKSCEQLQLINFKPEYLMKPPKELIELCSSSCLGECLDNLSCRRNKLQSYTFFTVRDREDMEEGGEDYSYLLQFMEAAVRGYFEQQGEMEAFLLDVVYEQVSRNLRDIANVPDDLFDNKVLPELPKLKKTDPTTQLAKDMNCLYDNLSEESNSLSLFISIIWFCCFEYFEDFLIEVLGVPVTHRIDSDRRNFS